MKKSEPLVRPKKTNPAFVGDYERFDNAMTGKGAFDPIAGEKVPVVVPWYHNDASRTPYLQSTSKG